MKRIGKYKLNKRRHLPFSWKKASRPRRKNPVQTFQFLKYTWNIDKAQALIEARKKKDKDVKKIEVDPVFDAMRWITPEKVEFGGRVVDPEYAKTTNLKNPIIFGLYKAEGTWYSLLIDGHHRLYRAKQEGVKTLPAYFLNKRENHQSMMAPWKFPAKKLKRAKKRRRQR